jgi:hypothetical protein
LAKPDNYLKRYADKYRVPKGEDGIWQIQTTHAPKNGLAFEVYDLSGTHLAVLPKPLSARNLLRKCLGVFTVHQDAGDGTVLLFEEDLLHDLAKDLKLRRKRQVSDAERKRLAEMSRFHSPYRKAVESKKHFSLEKIITLMEHYFVHFI